MLSFKQYQMLSEAPPAWHGTPHHFDAFSLDRIGTGEGHQAYGWGLYFSSSRAVAEYYRDELFDDAYVDKVNARMDQLVKEMEPYRAFEYGKFKDPRGYELKAEYDRLMDERHERVFNKALYHVEIIPSEDTMLDWDVDPSKQSEYIRNIIQNDTILNPMLSKLHSGEDVYRYVQGKLDSDKKASKYLLSIGIRGIKYLDAVSRVSGSGTMNYVIFDDKDVIIKEKL